ncbi:hypothetical protein BCR39DRAFT_526792 [Naematelia encephala]|uniref:Hexosyltransferase n=1 Tax=Naematelia encephala TaxID=71784 RepID=A0A1Y2B9E7_9TREE|nr:hypothetical protein BCR39DRAFT_526792 [Naematelia encephala]
MSSPAQAYPPQRPLTTFSQRLRYLLRPSVRLKTTLYSLTLAIALLVLVALNAARASSSSSTTSVDSTLNTSPTQISPADSGEGHDVAQGKDAHLLEEEIQRSFEEPDFALLSGKQPHEIGCDVPLHGDESQRGVLVFLGIFSAADKRSRRDLYRRVILPDFPPHLVTVKFILGLPPYPEKPISADAISRSQFLRQIHAEMDEFGDMVLLPMIDNIDLGKTHEYFKWVANEYAGPGRVKGRPRFVMKADDDTILVMPNVISAFKDLDCSTNVYWGTSAGRSGYFGDYFRGLAYAMSWPLVSWIGSADMPLAHTIKIEDARTGQWLRHLDPITDPIHRIDMGWTMGDWNQLDVGVETVALHWCKLDEWVQDQHDRLLQIWADADRPYSHEHGVAPRLSIQKGRMTPEEAEKEHQRQKDLGWDVQGNVHP